jgi:hypothetical protein
LKWQKFDEETKVLLAEYEEPLLDKEGTVAYDPEHWAMLEREGYKPTSPWYVGMCNGLNNDPIKIAQELDVSFVGSSDNVVDPSYIEMQRTKNVREPDPELHDKDLQEVWIWKLPIEGHNYILSVDNSRGDSDDATALEIFDLDGIDDDGMPCIEQVLEYNGKLFGDVIGELANNYGRLYNNAFCVVESIGGYGDATLLTLMNLEYPNLYYDDVDLKDYMRQGRTALKAQNGKMPGFHNGNNRFQMLSNFASMIRNNQFKIRSSRVIAELETWVWKNGKQDHMDGFHDDTITCLAMGLFVVQFSMQKEMRNKAMDVSIMKALIQANSRIKFGPSQSQAQTEIEKKYTPQIFMNREPLHQDKSAAYRASMWLVN